MSIDVNWETATSGPDGEALAEHIRSFIHDKFQQVALPRFIRSVHVHSFDFGTIPPDLEIKDFCEPFTDFYEEDDDDEISEVSEELVSEHDSNTTHDDESQWPGTGPPSFHDGIAMNNQQLRDPFDEPGHQYDYPSALRSPMEHLNSHFLPRAAGTPGLPVGTSTLGYHLMSLGALSGTQTPLAAVAGGSPFANGWSDSGIGPASRMRLEKPSVLAYPHAAMQQHQLLQQQQQRQQQQQQQQQQHLEADVDSASRPSTASYPTAANKDNPNNGPDDPIIPSPGTSPHLGDPPSSATHPHNQPPPPPQIPLRPPPRMRERKPEDFQVLCHAKYAGDIRLSLTAEILLDYPMPSFVGLPLKLNVTGITFDGVAVIAYIRKRVHFCFLSAEDADALLGSEEQQKQGDNSNPAVSNISAGLGLDTHNTTSSAQKRQGGLLQEIRVESEIGRKEDGKQVLKNVGKVERFVLAQVRRIFEEELVFPSFWTFLV